MTARFVPISAYTLPDNSLTQHLITEALTQSTGPDRSHVLEEESAEVEPKVILQSIQKQVMDQYQTQMSLQMKAANSFINLTNGNIRQPGKPSNLVEYAYGDHEASILFSIQDTEPSNVIVTRLNQLDQRCKELTPHQSESQSVTCQAVLGSEDLQRRLTPKTP